MKNFFVDKKNLIILLLLILFLVEAPQEENIRFIFWVLGGVIIASSCDALIRRVFLHQETFPKSAVISGFITAGILNYNGHWFVLALFSCLAIFFKYVIRFRGRHIFNPANFALFLASIFKIPLTWNIESNIYIIVALGVYMAWSLKKIPHILGFLIFFIVLFASQGINPFSLISWFFIFIMLIEPKTSGFGTMRGLVFGSIAGIASFLIFKFTPQYDFFVGSLFVANMFNPLLGKIKK